MESQKKQDYIINKLLSPNENEVLTVLSELKETGNTNILPIIIDLYSTTESNLVKSSIYNILAELKHTDSIAILIHAIENPKYFSIREDLVKTCWENGLNFSPYISTFVDLVINGDYMTSFEAFTVIENLEYKISTEEATLQLKRITQALRSAKDEKAHLLTELSSIIEQLSM
jgi:hypothetical protein